MSDLGTEIGFAQRVEALLPYTEYGANYIRGVASELRTARDMASQGRWQEAEYWLGQAEQILSTLLARRATR